MCKIIVHKRSRIICNIWLFVVYKKDIDNDYLYDLIFYIISCYLVRVTLVIINFNPAGNVEKHVRFNNKFDICLNIYWHRNDLC